jgi:hypothetical protein
MSEETWIKIQKRKNIKITLNMSQTRSKKLKLQDKHRAADIEGRNTRRDKRKWGNEQANKAEDSVRKGDIKEIRSITRNWSKRKY